LNSTEPSIFKILGFYCVYQQRSFLEVWTNYYHPQLPGTPLNGPIISLVIQPP
jgi:hypothetical protein